MFAANQQKEKKKRLKIRFHSLSLPYVYNNLFTTKLTVLMIIQTQYP